ncbi:MAG: hypothetical protein J6W82_05015 [Bacteroidales bacterium]|nr:hypothetical protein [Bacteroidales bacterium]
MSIFDQLGQANANPMQMLQQLRADPAAFLGKAGLSIPAGMTSPQQILQHLMQSGQVTQGRYQQAMQMMGKMKR